VQQWTHFPGLKSKYGVRNLIMEVKLYVLGSVGFTVHKKLHVAQDIIGMIIHWTGMWKNQLG